VWHVCVLRCQCVCQRVHPCESNFGETLSSHTRSGCAPRSGQAVHVGQRIRIDVVVGRFIYEQVFTLQQRIRNKTGACAAQDEAPVLRGSQRCAWQPRRSLPVALRAAQGNTVGLGPPDAPDGLQAVRAGLCSSPCLVSNGRVSRNRAHARALCIRRKPGRCGGRRSRHVCIRFHHRGSRVRATAGRPSSCCTSVDRMESFAPDQATFSNFQIGVSSLERDLDGVIFEFPSPGHKFSICVRSRHTPKSFFNLVRTINWFALLETNRSRF